MIRVLPSRAAIGMIAIEKAATLMVAVAGCGLMLIVALRAVPQDSCCQPPLSGAAGSPFPDPKGVCSDRW